MTAPAKDDLRRAALAARAGQPAGHADTAAARLATVLAAFGPVPVAGYLPLRSEISPLPAMASHPGPVAVPEIVAQGAPLVFRRWTPGCDLAPGPFRTQVPVGTEEIVPRVVIVPLVAFDRTGARLGYGGGFYDRTLEALRRQGPVTAIGYAFAAQEAEAVPTEPTDQPLDLIVTEAEVIRP